jgi:hypothetical protein
MRDGGVARVVVVLWFAFRSELELDWVRDREWAAAGPQRVEREQEWEQDEGDAQFAYF